jgi:membrane protease YdiL (CAAX protease family)
VFEELLFRGHVQTILVRLFTPSPMPQPLPPLAVMAADTAHALPIPPPLDYAAPDVKAVEVAPGLRWIAIFITSLIFAGVHPMWMAPMIFILSLCLGYAYERTGNLWVNIVMHAIFNLSSTVIFLNVG